MNKGKIIQVIGSTFDAEFDEGSIPFNNNPQDYVNTLAHGKALSLSKHFPDHEKYSLTNQIRRSSRSICSNLSEGWRKRRYKAVFVNKLSDAGQESAETQTWLEFALTCGYIDRAQFDKLDEKYEHIYAMLATMERKADSFCKAR